MIVISFVPYPTSSGSNNSSGSIANYPITIPSDGLTSFTLPSAPSSSSDVLLFLNGVKQLYGTDFTISGTTVNWLSSYYVVSGSDTIEAVY